MRRAACRPFARRFRVEALEKDPARRLTVVVTIRFGHNFVLAVDVGRVDFARLRVGNHRVCKLLRNTRHLLEMHKSE